MNDQQLEQELARLCPAAPSEALMQRLRAAKPSKVLRFPFWLTASAAAAAAAAMITLVFLHSPHMPGPSAPSAPSANPETFQTTQLDQYLVSARDLGVVEASSGQPYRLIHCVWADRESFSSATSPAHLEVQQTREQIIPVALTIH